MHQTIQRPKTSRRCDRPTSTLLTSHSTPFSVAVVMLLTLIAVVARTPTAVAASGGTTTVTDLLRAFGDAALRSAATAHSDADLSCVQQFNATLQAAVAGEMWAVRMFDAWGKFPSGILAGNHYELGDFDGCLQVQQPTSDELSDRPQIRGQYCLAQVYPSAIIDSASPSNTSWWSTVASTILPPALSDPVRYKGMDTAMLARVLVSIDTTQSTSLMVALCMPQICTPAMVAAIFTAAAQRLEIPVAASVTAQLCTQAAVSPWTGLDWAAASVFAAVAAAMILSTGYDLYMTFCSTAPSSKSLVLIAFSVYTNGTKLFHRDVDTSNNTQVTCLNGVRALSIVWVLFGHSYMMLAIGPLANTADLLPWLERPYSPVLMSGNVAVDTFFLMSGLLVTWSLLRYLDRCAGRLNLGWFYAHRYLRLTPSLAAAMLLCAALLRRLGDGPLWHMYLNAADVACRRWWWTALLYVQNYANPAEMCMGHSWYLSVDMQLYVLAPALVWPLWRCRRWRPSGRWAVFAVLPALVAVSMATTFGIFWTNGFSDRMLTNMLGGRSKELTYYPTHCRMGAWLIGVMLGYVMHENRNRKVSIARHWIALGWSVSAATMCTVIFANYPLQSPAYPESVLASAFYQATSHVVWPAAVAWLVFACAHGNGGPVNWLLSLPGWQPLARLTYAIYLLHLPVQLVLAAQVRVPAYFSDMLAIAAFWSAFGLTLTVAVVWTLAFESPVLALERVLLRPAAAAKRETEGGRRRGEATDATDSISTATEADDDVGERPQGAEGQRHASKACDAERGAVGSSQEDLVRSRGLGQQSAPMRMA